MNLKAVLGALLASCIGVGAVQAFQASDSDRWFRTATDGSGLGQGDPTTLTWSLAPNSTSIPGFNGEPTSNSNLISFFDGLYGDGGGGADLTGRPWFSIFDDSFSRINALSGLTYVYEANDDARTFSSSSFSGRGILGTRGDIRIGGHSIDGQSGSNTLAYNFFPDNGEMVIDTDNSSFYNSRTNASRAARNVIMHEAGHGIGLNHVESNNARFLMEPFINTSFDGPQLDDILGIQRLYGDAREKNGGNNTAATATSLGTIVTGNTASIGTNGNSTVVGANDTDFLSIDDNGDTDYFSFTVNNSGQVTVTLTPKGATYNQGPQNGSQSSFDASSLSDLALILYDQTGLTPLDSVDANGVGVGETINLALASAGTYFARVTGGANNVQLYQLDVDFVEIPEPASVLIMSGIGALVLIRRRRGPGAGRRVAR